MPLSTFAQYAFVASLFALSVIVIALYIKSRLDRRTFENNVIYTMATTKAQLDQTFDRLLEDTDFDDHVASTPGMTSALYPLN